MALAVRRRRDDSTQPRTDLFGQLERLNRELTDHLRAWRDIPDLVPEGFTPHADVEETADAYVVDIELAGVDRDDVDIEVAGRRLLVHGERKEKERVGILRRRERTVGRFSFEVTLPGDIEEDRVEARLDGGVLTVRLPKPERDRPRHIDIR